MFKHIVGCQGIVQLGDEVQRTDEDLEDFPMLFVTSTKVKTSKSFIFTFINSDEK